MNFEKWITLAVALLTWGGVFFYLLRVETLAKSLEKKLDVSGQSPETSGQD